MTSQTPEPAANAYDWLKSVVGYKAATAQARSEIDTALRRTSPSSARLMAQVAADLALQLQELGRCGLAPNPCLLDLWAAAGREVGKPLAVAPFGALTEAFSRVRKLASPQRARTKTGNRGLQVSREQPPVCLAAAPSAPMLTLSFRDAKLMATEFVREAGRPPVGTSVFREPRRARLHWRQQLKAICAFFLRQAAWAATNPGRARAEIDRAIAAGWEMPPDGPIYEGGPGTAVPTLFEVIKSKRGPVVTIFDDALFIDDAFGKRTHPCAVWLNVAVLSPCDLRILIDGEIVTDTACLLDLAAVIERGGGWRSTESGQAA